MLATFIDLQLDGLAALESVIAASPYRTIEQAVASLTIFSHPETVRQTACQSFVRTVRNAVRRGQVEDRGGVSIAFDDNKSPTDAFLWCNGLKRRPRETQFNHVYANSADHECYTSLANLCATPSFLAKLTDTDERARALLRFRAFDLYRWVPPGLAQPEAPPGYRQLEWAHPLPPVANVEAMCRAVMARRPGDRTVKIARRIGWIFSGYESEVPGLHEGTTVAGTDD